MSSSTILRELSSNNGVTTTSAAGSLRAASSSAKSRGSYVSRESTVASASATSTKMSSMFQKLNEQDVTRALHNLDRQYRMKDGAPRVLFWSSALKLPCNHDAFRTLSLRRVDVRVASEAMREVKGLLAFARDERCNSRLWSCLVIHDSKIAPIPFIPYLCVAVCRGIPSNPICAFETSMHMLGNLCREWVEAYPRPPMRVLSRLDKYIQSHATLSGLWRFFNDDHLDGGCSLLDYIWVPMQTFLLLNIKPAETWVQFMDDVVCSPDGNNIFYGAVIALLWQLKDAFYVCDSRDQVLAVLGTEIHEPKAIQQLLQRSRNIAAKLVVPLDAPIEYLPVRGEYYPLLHVGGRPPIPEKVDKAARLKQIEEDQEVLERRIAVEVSTLSMNAEMKRFHTSLGNLRFGGDESFNEKPANGDNASIPPRSHEPYYQPYTHATYNNPSSSRAAQASAAAGAAAAAAAVSPLNPIRLCSLVMEGPSEPIENDLAARRRDEDGEVYYATTEDDATTTHHTAPPSEPPLPIMNSLSPQDRGISVVPDAVVRAAALMLASQSVSRQRSESMNPPSHQAGSPLRPLELSASLSPTQRGASTAPSGNPNQQSFNASVGYTQPSASHAGRSSHTGSSVRPAAFAK